ncbi:bifunctional metallophosphatase/5'-nucleotidase [Vagococcus vulneris]|uniref:Multifunctional 2',3'-cyclic-nucleotide 2'-phosphodiesterase/5'-nucleotidase/3'-nucleotidase n=1 Tax=Vagococcus vulneris TaxID=1977869 RepID=A0A429ZWQ8_9ENTE|nr:bifunctional UDP-sugar hydrolase/5'-nucleotidase [Vagococcus vulneris]RST98231.1 hypothetical protein CBF37_08670 [Vagococcus vulneris]
MQQIRFIHTNDIHSHFENWPRIRRFIKQQQKDAVQKGVDHITLDIGDFMDRQHPLTDYTNGQANVRLMNQVDYDAVTIGNNEGITNSHAQLNDLYNKSNFDVVLSNLKDKEINDTPKWAVTHKIITTKNGIKIGIMGLTAPMTLTYEPFGWQVLDVDVMLAKELTELKEEQVDCIVLLSHLGLPVDKHIADGFPSIDIIFGSHTHHLLENGLMRNGVLLAAAGRFGEYIGIVETVLDDNTNTVINKIASVTKTEDLPMQKSDSFEIRELEMLGLNGLKNQVITVLKRPLLREDSSLISLTADAMRSEGETAISFINSGLFLTDLLVGNLTALDLHQCLPHPMNLINVKLKGNELIRLVLEIEKNRDFLRNFPIVGMKFRGKVFGEMWYHGLKYDTLTKKVIFPDGSFVKADRFYTVTTVDHLLFLPFFPTLELAGETTLLGPKFLRNVLGDYLKKINSDEQVRK